MRHPATFFHILNFKREFKNFRMFKDVRISKILYVMQWCPARYQDSECFQYFFSSGRSFLYQYKKSFSCIKSETTFIEIFRMLLETRCWSLFLLLPALGNIQKSHVSIFYSNSANKHEITLFSIDISIIFLICDGFSKIKMNLKEYCNRIVYQLTQHLQIWRSYFFSWSYFGFCKRR